MRRKPDTRLEYLTAWVGYEDRTWEPAKNFVGAEVRAPDTTHCRRPLQRPLRTDALVAVLAPFGRDIGAVSAQLWHDLDTHRSQARAKLEAFIEAAAPVPALASAARVLASGAVEASDSWRISDEMRLPFAEVTAPHLP